MVGSNKSALGIIFPNSYDELVPELVNVRLMASIPFASRYRLIDFMLSSMSNCGISNVSVLVKKNYHSLMDHLDSGREWDLVRKNGGLNILPPNAERESKLYVGHVDALGNILDFLRSQKEKYVVMADTNIAANFDFRAMIDAHIASGADVTIAYNEQELPERILQDTSNAKGFYYTLDVQDGRVTDIIINPKTLGVVNFGMNIHVVDRELLIDLINTAYLRGQVYFERDVLLKKIDDGCVIEGEVENSVLFRGVRVAKGAKVKNCILMQDTVVEEGANLEYLISDKNVKISAGKEMKGTDTYPMYIAKNHTV